MFKFESTRLIEEMKRRAGNLQTSRASASIKVPEELKWWYFQEFGTFGGYIIAAKDGKQLKLPATEGHPNDTYVSSVIHPGVKPKHYIAKILPDIDAYAQSELRSALIQFNYNVEAVKSYMLGTIMPKVLDMIATSMGESLGPSREGGKLQGVDPENAYREGAEIVDTSE